MFIRRYIILERERVWRIFSLFMEFKKFQIYIVMFEI